MGLVCVGAFTYHRLAVLPTKPKCSDKEQWEPIIEKLLQFKGVSEAYSFDWPSHGEGALLNAKVLAAFEPIGVGTLVVDSFMLLDILKMSV